MSGAARLSLAELAVLLARLELVDEVGGVLLGEELLEDRLGRAELLQVPELRLAGRVVLFELLEKRTRFGLRARRAARKGWSTSAPGAREFGGASQDFRCRRARARVNART